MTKKEINEIRRLATFLHCRLDRICGCYIDHEKQKKTEFCKSVLMLPEEEIHKYLGLMHKALSGTIGKNLLNLSYSQEEELSGTRQQLLLSLRATECRDDGILAQFYDEIIAHYENSGNYLILLAFGTYDIPSVGSDRQMMEDASEEMYQFLLCSICPVEQDKPGLAYDAENNSFSDKETCWMVQMPDCGFLYPAFNDRASDLHSLLFYTKDPEQLHPELTCEVLGVSEGVSFKQQRSSFSSVVEETFGEDLDFEVVRSLHENLNVMMEEQKEKNTLPVLDEADLLHLFADCGASEEHLETTKAIYREKEEASPPLLVQNIANTRCFEIRTPSIKIQVDPSMTSLLETREVDGRPCLVIPIDQEVEINGILLHSFTRNKPV